MTTLERFLSNQPALMRSGTQGITTAIWGGVADEYDNLRAELDKITLNALTVDSLSGDELDEVIQRVLGIARLLNESDASRLRLLKAIYLRENIPSWATVHAIRRVFRWWFNDDLIYINENDVEANLIDDGDFEPFEVGVKTEAFGNWTPIGNMVSIEDTQVFEGSRVLRLVNEGRADTTMELSAGAYILSFFYKGYCPVKVTRASDGYYWDFESQAWVDTLSGLSLPNYSETYMLYQSPVIVEDADTVTVEFGPDYWDGIDGGDPTTEPTPPDPDLVFDGGYPASAMTESLDGRSSDTGVRVDMVSFGEKPSYPSIRVIVSSFMSTGGFLNNWLAGADPVSGKNYSNATFLEQDFIGGEGTGIPVEYYQAILNIIRPAGVKGVFEFVGRT